MAKKKKKKPSGGTSSKAKVKEPAEPENPVLANAQKAWSAGNYADVHRLLKDAGSADGEVAVLVERTRIDLVAVGVALLALLMVTVVAMLALTHAG